MVVLSWLACTPPGSSVGDGPLRSLACDVEAEVVAGRDGTLAELVDAGEVWLCPGGHALPERIPGDLRVVGSHEGSWLEGSTASTGRLELEQLDVLGDIEVDGFLSARDVAFIAAGAEPALHSHEAPEIALHDVAFLGHAEFAVDAEVATVVAEDVRVRAAWGLYVSTLEARHLDIRVHQGRAISAYRLFLDESTVEGGSVVVGDWDGYGELTDVVVRHGDLGVYDAALHLTRVQVVGSPGPAVHLSWGGEYQGAGHLHVDDVEIVGAGTDGILVDQGWVKGSGLVVDSPRGAAIENMYGSETIELEDSALRGRYGVRVGGWNTRLVRTVVTGTEVGLWVEGNRDRKLVDVRLEDSGVGLVLDGSRVDPEQLRFDGNDVDVHIQNCSGEYKGRPFDDEVVVDVCESTLVWGE